MTHAVNPVLPTIATIIKTLLTSSGVEINVEVLDRPVFLKRIRERDLDAEGAHWIMTKPRHLSDLGVMGLTRAPNTTCSDRA